MTLPVSEIFGPTIQGEGPRAGRVCSFVRLGGCNLACDFCDSEYSWNFEKYDMKIELTRLTAKEIMEALPATQEVVITGGEPLMHQRNDAWSELLRLLHRRRMYIAVETNGTFAPTETTQTLVDHYSISPKLPNAGKHKKGQSTDLAPWPSPIKHHCAILKFVVKDAADVEAACKVADDAQWQRDRVWMMPEGVDTETLIARWPEIVRASIDHGVNCTQRLHVFAFGDTRGT